ncbi:hypothetical protein, partial [Haloferax sp. KTX1]|uniref:hypothetical protein n=1 Tax=Haloferax sp. KTX1 TaxID=2600597 RepID=UPI001C9E4209
SEGKSCERVTNTNGLGRDESGNVYIAVACSNGGKHVIQVGSGNNMEYHASCAIWRGETDIDCF